MVGPAEIGVEELQESALAEEIVSQAGGGEADHGRPFVGFPEPVGDLELNGSVATTDGRGPADELDLSLLRPGQVDPEMSRHDLLE